MPPRIEISNLRKSFPHEGKERLVLDDISLAVEDRSFTTVVGPSGCGKSTMLNIIGNIESLNGGKIEIATEGGRPPRVGYVFQSPRLLPWLSVIDNMMFVKPPEVEAREYRERSERYLKMVGLDQEKTKFPLQLSGGMQQRVGIARALAIDPDVLLMDEPFSHLDELTAERLRVALLDIWTQTRKTIMFVTHDLQEALQLGDRMVIFGRNGRMLDDIVISLPRPREFTSDIFIAFYSKSTKRFFELQHQVDQGLAVAV